MLTIQEVNYYTRLIDKKLVDPILCPTAPVSEKHFTMSQVDNDFNVYFKCFECKSKFTLGLQSETNIKNNINKFRISEI